MNILDNLTPPTKPFSPNQLSTLTPQPEDLLHLPFMLEDLQAYIVGRMTYPSLSTAGIAALATMTAFVQTNITINSRDGLGFNEQYMILAPTGFGKEDITKPLVRLMSATDEMQSGGNLSGLIKTSTEIHYAAPSSMQGLHQDLEANNSVYYLSDEFAGWLKTSHTDGHKAQALNYLMQIYTKALSTVHPGAAVTKNYEPVKNPRVGVLATNTAESMFESLSREQAESGAYNRWIMFVSDEELPSKRYTGLIYEPDPKLVDYFVWLRGQTGIVSFSASGFERYIELDDSLAEPVKRRDALLGGRLSEQAIKMAGLIALSDKRFTIEPDDIHTAFNIRMDIYYRAAALAQHEGSLSGLHATVGAVRQITEYLRKNPSVYKTRLLTVSRKFNKLSVAEQNAVLNALYSGGVAREDPDNRKKIVSEVYQ